MKNKDNNKSNADSSIFKEWLETLQQESWQLELLISGMALYGIFESRSLLLDLNNYIHISSEGAYAGYLGMFKLILEVGWKIFLINLLIHIVLRGLWIGAIGLRYVSGEIDFDALNYSDQFSNYLKRKIGSYDQFIERLEKICSVIFAYTFLLFLLFVSLIMFVGFFSLVITIIEHFIPGGEFQVIYGMMGILYFVIGLVVLIDLFTLGGFKKIKEKSVSKVYLYFYIFISTITLSFLYRPLLYNFLDNKFTRRLFFFSIPYIFFVSFSGHLFSSNIYPYFDNPHNLNKEGLFVEPNCYGDLLKDKLNLLNEYDKKKALSYKPKIVLSQYNMTNSYPYVFFSMSARDKKLLQKNTEINPLYEDGFKFNLFSDEHPRIEVNLKNDSIEEIRKRLIPLRKSYRDSIKMSRRGKIKIDKEVFEAKLAHIQEEIKSTNTANEDFLSKNRISNNEKIMNSFIELITFNIDDINYKDSLQCKYYIRPETGEKGFICHFNSEYLDLGHHIIEYEKPRFTKPNEPRKVYSTKLPFIKVE